MSDKIETGTPENHISFIYPGQKTVTLILSLQKILLIMQTIINLCFLLLIRH